MKLIETDVLVVGAGPAGLTASALLARAGVKAIGVTKYGGTADSPRAHVTNQRAAEVSRTWASRAVCARRRCHRYHGHSDFRDSFAGWSCRGRWREADRSHNRL